MPKNTTETRSGFVSVIGRPNAGKSSLLNWLVGEKIALVSHKANATRRRSKIIALHENSQIIFIDTPGLHEKERLLNKFMMDEALKAMGDCDLILFLSPVTDKLDYYVDFLEKNKKEIPHFVLLTKVDNVSNAQVLKKIEEFSKYQDKFSSLIPVSIKKGVKQEYILEEISKYLPVHPYLYDPDILTTENMRDIYKEYIRESIFNNTSEEIPYFADVVVEKVEEREDIEIINASIIVEKKSQKGVLIGKDGQTLRRIGSFARNQIEKIANKKVYLKLYVTVKPGWSQNKDILKKLGYDLE
ncbi:MAG: GTPase Era [Sulfurospirillaceae bacterium]|nr:GTPase Era [Sulfurospirillaceae bacterium]